jgi:hypothetical protein
MLGRLKVFMVHNYNFIVPIQFYCQCFRTPVGRVPTCWNVVQPRSIVQLLAAEDTKSSMSRLLVELLFASLHPDDPIKLKQRSVVKRVSWLVKTNLQAARNFYENSE